MVVRPKVYKMTCSPEGEITVFIRPQQKWEAYEFEGEMYVSRNATTLKLSVSEFERMFEEVK